MSTNKKTMSQKLAEQAPPPPVGSVKLLSLEAGKAFFLLDEYGLIMHPGVTYIRMGGYQSLYRRDEQFWGTRVPCLPYGRVTHQDDVGQVTLIRGDADVLPVGLKPEPISTPPQFRHQNKEETDG